MAGQFFKVLTQAIDAFVNDGYSSPDQLEYWLKLLKRSILDSLTPDDQMRRHVEGVLRTTFEREIGRKKILSHHPGVSALKVDMLRPQLQRELDKRLLANVSLIKLNRERVVAQTMDRFAGWATSVPAGGVEQVKRNEVKATVRKSLAGLPFEERRVAIDQGAKFISSLNAVIAEGGGALAAIWHSHWRQSGYHYREDHKERDLHIYAIRDSWAIQKGLMKVGPDGYSDSITQPAEEPFCRCFWQYVYNLKDLPEELLTQKGRDFLAGVSQAVA